MVHMVTDSGANYVLTWRKTQDDYKSITWSLCAAHCLNLILKDMTKIPMIANKASRVT